MKILCTDIEWDTDGDERVSATLPKEFVVDLDLIGLTDITEENSTEVADYLSDQFGFCVSSFQYTVDGRPTPRLTDDELLASLEVARVALSDRCTMAAIGEVMDASDELLGALGNKLNAVMGYAEAPVTTCPTVVLELIDQQPSATVHRSEVSAMTHAVDCAAENLRTDDRASIRRTLAEHGSIREGDYEVYVLAAGEIQP